MSKQFTHGVSLNANYAWQKAMSEATGYSTWDRKAVRGRDSSLRQQQVIIYGLMELPFGRNHLFLSHANGVVNQIVGGWQVSPVINYSSGLPFTLSYNSCSSSVGGSAPCYVNGDTKQFHSHVKGFPGNGLSFYRRRSLWAERSPRLLWIRSEQRVATASLVRTSSTPICPFRRTSQFVKASSPSSGSMASTPSTTSTSACPVETSTDPPQQVLSRADRVSTGPLIHGNCSSRPASSSKLGRETETGGASAPPVPFPLTLVRSQIWRSN